MVLNRSGSGIAFIRDSAKQEFRPLALLDLTGSEEITTEDSQGFPLGAIGTLQTYETTTTESVWTFTASMEYLNETDIELWWYGQKGTSNTFTAPETGAFTVPAGAPYDVTVTGLTIDQTVEATILLDAAPGQQFLTQVASAGTPADGEFEVTANTISFNAAQAGLSGRYYYQKSYTLNLIGGTNAANPFENFEVAIDYKLSTSQQRRLWIPKCTFNTGGTAPVGGTDAIEREFKALVDTSIGANFPYYDFEIA